MKRIFKLLATVFSFILMGCSSNTPEDVATEFITAVHRCDFDKASKYCTKDSKGLMNRQARLFKDLQQKYDMFEEREPEITLLESAISEDGTKAGARFAIKNSSIIRKKNDKAIEVTVNMLKEDGQWKAIFEGR